MSSEAAEYSLKGIVKELLKDKLGLAGIILLIFLIIFSIYAVYTIPYSKAISLWRGENNVWIETPRNARPYWYKYLVGKNLPQNIVVDSRYDKANVIKVITPIPRTNLSQYYLEMSFNYPYDDFPSELNIFFHSNFTNSPPVISIYWQKPGGNKTFLLQYTLSDVNDTLYLTINSAVENYIKERISQISGGSGNISIPAEQFLFAKEDSSILNQQTRQVLKGRYKIYMEGYLFERNTTLDARVVVYGKIYGLAGTDSHRRDLMIGLLWGAPIDLSFGLLASLIITLSQLVIATISGYYGGKTDSVIQRITEIYMILPFLPFLILIAAFYKINIWVLLIVVIILSIFGGGIKTTRALVMQIKEYPYVEAARAYGASNLRIIFLYIIPKILPPVIPGLILAIPNYVFLEAALSFLGLGDPLLPTWGKVIDDAFSSEALYKGYYYWVLEPSMMLVLTAFVFAFIGFALDKIINPRLKEL